MKMTKIKSARIIVKQRGICYNFNHSETISCDDCFNGRNRKKCVDFTDEKTLALAESYIKRHEQKSKKKNHIRDTTKKVESTAVSYEPCVSCRNNHGLCSTKERTANVKNCVSYDPIIKKKVEEPTVKENLSVEPDPIRIDIPNVFYCPTPDGILRFKRSQIILKDTNNEDCLLKYHEEYPCYRTIEEAVIVAKRLWSIK